MPAGNFETVDQYIASLDETKGETIRKILDLVTTEFPELETKLAWNLPMVHKKGKYIAGLAAYKNHLSFSPWSADVLKTFTPRLSDYVVTKNMFQIPVDWCIDVSLVRDLVSARLAELDV